MAGYQMPKDEDKQCIKTDDSLFKILLVISNGNRTEWSTIQGVIGRVILNQPSA